MEEVTKDRILILIKFEMGRSFRWHLRFGFRRISVAYRIARK